MSLKARIEADVRQAMKAQDVAVTSALRLVVAAIKNREIEKRGPLDDGEVMKVMSGLLKQRMEAAEMFRRGGRPELAAKEEKETALLSAYLPKPLSDAELETLVTAAISEAGASSVKDLGAVMKVLSPRVQGRAEGKRVTDVIRKKLS